MRLLVMATGLILAAQAGKALASDLDTLPPPPLAPTIVPDEVGGWYGNVHVGAAMDSFSTPTQIIVPYGNIGGKIAYDGGAGNFGFQADGDFDYGDLAIVSPSQNGLSGNYSTANGAAHLTYMWNDNVKFGIFAGVATAGFSAKYPAGYSIPSLSANPIISGNATLGLLGAGLEALAVIDNTTTIQARLTFLDPSYLSYSYSDGTTPVSATTFDMTAGYGYSVSGSASRHFGQHFLARVDGSYANITASYLGVSGNLSEVTGAVTGQYSFSSMPVSLGATAGLASASAAGYSTMGYMLGVKATYSFGGAGRGAEGHLFNSGIFNALF